LAKVFFNTSSPAKAYIIACAFAINDPAVSLKGRFRRATLLDGAVVDINLQGELAYPIGDALIERGIPFVFTTGYDQAGIPTAYAPRATVREAG
jgi:hypothetical protein